jgi:hypothetical protein
MLKYGDFILEKVIYDLILESQIEFSKSFLGILGGIKHPIAQDILALQSQDKKVNYNYIDVDIKTNDEITFIQDARAQRMVKDVENLYKLTNSNNHLKISDFKTEEGRQQNAHIYELLGLNIEEAKKAPQNSKIKILGKLVSPYDSNKVYVAYECATDPTMKAVININGVQEDTEVYQKLWTTARNPLKIGRFINAMLPLTGKTYSDSEKEKFVSEWKSILGVMNNAFAKFAVVSGNEIYRLYQSENYEEEAGTLGNSCMAQASSDMLEIYTDNPEVCQMVVKWSDRGQIIDGSFKSDKIVGRAILWKTTSGDMFMDRIYTIDSSDEELFKKYAESNGWWAKKGQSSSQNFTAVRGSESKNPIYVVQLLRGYNGEYPYLDTLCYLNDNRGKLSNSSSEIGANKLLNDTGGGYDEQDPDDDDY